MCCSPWDCKGLDKTKQLNSTELILRKSFESYCTKTWFQCLHNIPSYSITLYAYIFLMYLKLLDY